MKSAKYLLLLVIALSVQLASAQTTNDQPSRQVKGQTLTSENLPKIRIKFNKKFKFAGSQDFVLYNRAKAEQYFFIKAENKKIKQMFMLQFERFLPDIAGKYEYNEPKTIEIGGLNYFSNAETIPNVEAALKAVPDSDIARAAKFLQEKGFTLMKSLLYQRFVRVLDASKRSEFIILYVEDSESVNLPAKEKSLEDLSERALANFKVKE